MVGKGIVYVREFLTCVNTLLNAYIFYELICQGDL